MEEVVPNWWYWKTLGVTGGTIQFAVGTGLLFYGLYFPSTKHYEFGKDALICAAAIPIGFAVAFVALIRLGIL